MSGQDAGDRAPLRGDEEELFRDFNRPFIRTVQWLTNAPPEIVHDACGFAWQQFICHQPDRDRNWRSWLITTAEREAWRLRGIEAGHLSLSVREGRELADWDVPDPRDELAIRARLREALSALAEVPKRRRDLKALQITGFSYEEICAMRGLSYTRVNAILNEANKILREQQGREARVAAEVSPRAARLHELEDRPPEWLRAAIGRRPGLAQDPRAILAWRRAALALDDYRRDYGRGLGDVPLGNRPRNPEAARAFDLASSAIRRVAESRQPRRGLGRDL